MAWFKRKRKDDPGRSGTEDRGDAPRQSTEEATEFPSEPSQESSSTFFSYIRERLRKTRQMLGGQIDRLVLGKKEIDQDTLEELEEVLITSDLGVDTTRKVIAAIEQKLQRRELSDADELRTQLRGEILRLLEVKAQGMD
ncbi:MAG: signal recognition particle receptor subunit alpha, partial [Syntrophobacteria bacterium]